MQALEEAIQVGHQAVELTPEGHPDRARILTSLGINFASQYELTGAAQDLEEAIRVHDRLWSRLWWTVLAQGR